MIDFDFDFDRFYVQIYRLSGWSRSGYFLLSLLAYVNFHTFSSDKVTLGVLGCCKPGHELDSNSKYLTVGGSSKAIARQRDRVTKAIKKEIQPAETSSHSFPCL